MINIYHMNDKQFPLWIYFNNTKQKLTKKAAIELRDKLTKLIDKIAKECKL